MKEIVFFMNMSEHEQRVRLAGKIPSTEEYWEYRMGTSAVGICLAVIESVSKPGIISYRDANIDKFRASDATSTPNFSGS